MGDLRMGFWTTEEDAVLERMVAEGHSASVVSRKVGRSRVAVLSRAHRKHLHFQGQQPTVRLGLGRDPFTKGEDAKIREMAEEGMSGAEIAKALDRHKSSLVKRARILGVQLKGKGGQKKRAVPTVRLNPRNIVGKKESRKRDPGLEHLTPSVAVEPLLVPLMDLKDGMCRFPVAGDRADTLFCGHPKDVGSYCRHHAAIAYTAPEMRRAA